MEHTTIAVDLAKSVFQVATDRPMLMRTTLVSACHEIECLERHMRAVERQPTALARDRADVTLWQTGPGVGLITATALVALVGDIRRFRSSRHFASVLGLPPKEPPARGAGGSAPSASRGTCPGACG